MHFISYASNFNNLTTVLKTYYYTPQLLNQITLVCTIKRNIKSWWIEYESAIATFKREHGGFYWKIMKIVVI